MKITILDGAVENPGDLSWEALAALGDLTVYDYTAPEEILPRIGDAPIILTNKTPITRQTMDECPNLRYIGVLATGFNVIDVAAAKEKGIVVANVPSYGTQAVAQFVMAQLLEICHRIGHHNDAVQQGRWTACRDFSFWDYPLMELAGKTFGIVGYGRIGQATAELARAFGMNVIYYSRHGSGEGYVPLDELYARSDIVSLHCPQTPENVGMIDKTALAKMKDGVIFAQHRARRAHQRSGFAGCFAVRQGVRRRVGRGVHRADSGGQPAAGAGQHDYHAAHRVGKPRGAPAADGYGGGECKKLLEWDAEQQRGEVNRIPRNAEKSPFRGHLFPFPSRKETNASPDCKPARNFRRMCVFLRRNVLQ